MRIISMIATFGKLDGDTLRFQPGLNVIAAPNEWGKSTWCAFLAAMLYGVETKERTTKGQLADKEKYMPWSGRPMEGMLRLEHEGRDITIQRRTRGRIPLGDFLAYETRTGLPVKELTAENCGESLLGVEKSVFMRTGFIRFSDLAVVPDETLWQRLQRLVTTGDESDGTAVLGKKLRELKNKCRSSRGGLIPDTQRQIGSLQAQLSERESLQQRIDQLERQAESARGELAALERHRSVCAWRDARADREQTEAAVQAAKDARDACEELEERCRQVPVRSELVGKLRQAQSLLDQLREVPEEDAPSAMAVVLFGVLAVLALMAAGVALFKKVYVWAIAAGVFALVFGFSAGKAQDLRRKKELKQRIEQSKREKRTAELLGSIQRWQSQLALREELETARRTAEQTRIRLQSMVSLARKAADEEQEDDLDLSLAETEERIASLTERLRQLQLRLGQCQGRAESLPEQENILRRLETEKTRLAELETWEKALEHGLEALEEASQELQRRFAPRLTKLTQEYFSRLTGGRYNRLTIGQDLSVQAANESETTLRSAQWRSDGTADQMSLALRLAVWVTLNPRGPLVLDDALIRLDDRRLELAMDLLKELSQTRQIILFSCQEREKRSVES